LAEAGQHALDIDRFPLKTARLPDGHPDLESYWQSRVSADWDLQDPESTTRTQAEINGVYGAGPQDKHRRGRRNSVSRPKRWRKRKRLETRAMVDVSNDRLGTRFGDPGD